MIELLTDIAAHSQRIHQLYCEVQRNAAVKLVTVPESYLPTLAETLGTDFRCHVARRGEEIVGFVTTVRDGTTAIAYVTKPWPEPPSRRTVTKPQ